MWSAEEELDKFKRLNTHGGKRRWPDRFRTLTTVRNIEHNQEADHWANIGTQGLRKIVLDRRDNSESWKAIRGFWFGSFKGKGRSGCCIVINGPTGKDG